MDHRGSKFEIRFKAFNGTIAPSEKATEKSKGLIYGNQIIGSNKFEPTELNEKHQLLDKIVVSSLKQRYGEIIFMEIQQ